ncbi:MAG: CoA transferase [Rhodobacterales bacterium]|nr:CoA transferase [Rhodobacterales bacterium]MDX5501788.1 CoA transferase [Rhodobacterales bacterium]
MGPLAGLKVIDLTSVVMGPYATQFLGDFGADVIKVEAPAGDLVRGIGPAIHDGMGPMFLNSNRSKRSIAINLKAPEGRALLLRLCKDADVLVYNVRPAAMNRLGLSWDEVSAVNPRLIYAGLYGYGQDGPYAARPAYDDLIQGGATVAHLFQVSGSPEPRYIPTAVADRVVGLMALSAILAAVVARQTTGKGQRVDVPMFESMVGFVLSDHLSGLTYDPPLDRGGYPRQLAPNRRPLKTADGHVCALIYTDDHWRRFLTAIGEPERMDDPRFGTFAGRNRNYDSVYGWLLEKFESRTSEQWIQLLDKIDVPVMAMHTFESVLEDPHLKAVNFFQHVTHPTEGPLVSMANPVRMSATPVEPPRLAPNFAEHTQDVLREAGLTQPEIDALLRDKVVMAR